MADTSFQAPVLTAPHDATVKADNGICHGRVLQGQGQFFAQLIDTSAQTKANDGPFTSRADAERRIVKFLNDSEAYYASMKKAS